MKHVSSITLSLLLFLFITNLSQAFSTDKVEAISDTFGNPLYSGGKYYILPALGLPRGGGIKLGKTGDLKCNVTVLQDYEDVEVALPVKFTVPDISTGTIFTGTPIDIEFTEKPKCAKSSKWLIFVDDIILKACVGIGGPENYPAFKTLNGTFYIKKHESGFGYYLGFCVSESTVCLDLGNFNDDEGGRRLNLTHQEAFHVVFVDASSPYDKDDEIIKSVV